MCTLVVECSRAFLYNTLTREASWVRFSPLLFLLLLSHQAFFPASRALKMETIRLPTIMAFYGCTTSCVMQASINFAHGLIKKQKGRNSEFVSEKSYLQAKGSMV